jgi:transcriptional regulator with XRE-family HTH domain
LNRALKRLRASRGLTQQQFAVAAGLSVAAVAQLKGGRTTDPRASALRALARALGVRVDELCNAD